MNMKPAKAAHIHQKNIHVKRRFCWQRAGAMYVELQRRLKPVKQSEIEESAREKEVGMQKCNDL